MRPVWEKCLTWILVLTFLALPAVPLFRAIAFGDFDSGSDWGGSDYSGSDSSYYDRYDSDSGSSSRGSSPLTPIIVIILIVFYGTIFLISLSQRSSGTKRSSAPAKNKMQSLDDLQALDPGFSRDALIERIKQLFIRMQECWEAGNIFPLQDSFTESCWYRFDNQLRMKNGKGETTHVRDIVFQDVVLRGFQASADTETLFVYIRVDYNVWTTNKEGRCVMGSPETRHRMEFQWTIQRPAGPKTAAAAQDTQHCPNCGKEVDVNAFAECPYCHSALSRPAQDWVISGIQGISQVTLHK